jgi:hypothetical protein
MAKRKSGSVKGPRKTSEKHKVRKKPSETAKYRKIVLKPLKVADLKNIQESVEKGIALVWENENRLAVRLKEVGRLANRALEQLDVLGNGAVKILKRVESLEKAASGEKKGKASTPDDVKKTLKKEFDAHRKALEKDLNALRKEIGTLRRDLKKGEGGGVTPDLLQNVLVEQINAVDKRLKALEKAPPGGGPREAVPEAGGKMDLGVAESKLFVKFLRSEEMKDLLDERFKLMRDWLRDEEIPKQVKKVVES